MVRDGIMGKGKRVVTFSPLLNFEKIPLAGILSEVLQIGQKSMSNPVEIEFAVNMDTPQDSPAQFNLLQIRPIVLNEQSISFNLDDIREEDTIVYSESVLGNGSFQGLRDIVYVDPARFSSLESKKIALIIEGINKGFVQEKRNYILIGPGRWGSADPALGIPTKWDQLSAARVIIEAGLEDYRIDPSQGTHFFHNITSFGIGYFTINPYINEGFYDLEYLAGLPSLSTHDQVRHVRFPGDLRVEVDGRTNKGVIYKPEDG
jgi:hypothetical protein